MKHPQKIRTLLAALAIGGLAIVPAAAQHEGHGHSEGQPAAPAHPAPRADKVPNPDATGIVFETEEHDFGAIHQGEKVTAEFAFENKSDKTIEIEKIRTSCGCTAAALDKRTYAPGEGEKITVTFNSAGRKGAQHKVITVSTNDPDHPAYQLKIACNVITEMEMTARILNFGSVQEGDGASKEVALLDFAETPIEIKNIEVQAEGIEVAQGDPEEYLDTATGRKGRKIPFLISVKKDFPAGRLLGRVMITTSNEHEPVQSVAITGTVRGDLAVSPNQVFFGVIAPDSDLERVARLMVRDDLEFKMTGFTLSQMSRDGKDYDLTDNIDVKLTNSEANPKTQLLSLYFLAPGERGTYKGIVTASGTVGEKKAEVNLPFQAVIRPEVKRQADGQPSTADVISGRATLPRDEIKRQQDAEREKLLQRRMELQQRVKEAKEKAASE
ncbi:DUF1573 domain-containing protein [bacterium]|nr:DUF1573 domain-containing protein [bacterium]